MSCRKYSVTPLRPEDMPTEIENARNFWANYAIESHYLTSHELSEILLRKLSEFSFESVLELGCNAGRNLYYIRQKFPAVRVKGIDLNEKAVQTGRELFHFTEDELQLGDDCLLESVPSESYDVVFTLSVLDHLPAPAGALSNLIRIARRRIILIEFALEKFGKVEGDIVAHSYSHDYARLLKHHSELISNVRIERIAASAPFHDYYTLVTADRRAKELESVPSPHQTECESHTHADTHAIADIQIPTNRASSTNQQSDAWAATIPSQLRQETGPFVSA